MLETKANQVSSPQGWRGLAEAGWTVTADTDGKAAWDRPGKREQIGAWDTDKTTKALMGTTSLWG